MKRHDTSNWASLRSISRAALLLLWLLPVLSGCGKPGVGDACKQDSDCPTGGSCLGVLAGFPNGYCSSDCSVNACDEGQSCTVIGQGDNGMQVCLRGCQGAADCRDGSQCYEGTCQPRCQQDADCNNDGYT